MMENMEDLSNIIVLNDENGDEVQFEFLDLVEYAGEEYVVLLPVEDDDGMVVVLKVVPIDEENESYCSVDDDDVLEAVFEIFKEKFQNEFKFTD